MKKLFLTVLSFCLSLGAFAFGETVTWDSQSLIIGGHRVVPVMGEIHFSRLPADEWKAEVRKMKEGGCTIIATYVFWTMHEEEEGIFDWSGQRDLRRFISICQEEGLPVVLRIGPFCHGECRNGGIPDWLFNKPVPVKMRSEDPEFLSYAEKLYRQIYSQIIGLQWKDGGPIIACQFDNEYRGKASYLLKLKEIATSIGFDLPFYTRTGWPELSTPVPFGELLPLYGDYADGFWERSIKETAGNYYKAFNFKAFRSSTAIASEQLKGQKERITAGDEQYPYFTCELGGGMATAYHRRPYMYSDDALAMAVVKLGSGSNLLGYYMYHGGTNPESRTGNTFNEKQQTYATNYNDMPVKNYDFQAPLGEFGQIGTSFYPLRKLHLFMHDMAETLAPMQSTFPTPQDISKGDDTQLRWCYRSQGDSGFVFINNYERLQNLTDKRGIRFDVGTQTFPKSPITIPAGTIAVMPFNICGMQYATAQIVACRNGNVYLQPIKGIKTEIALQGGKTLKNVKPQGAHKPVTGNIYLLAEEEADTLFSTLGERLPLYNTLPAQTAEATLIKPASGQRNITTGQQKAAEAPTDEEFQKAAVFSIELPAERTGRIMEINYAGDCARIYAGNRLVADNFYNGRPMLLGLWRISPEITSIELRILPQTNDMPVYLPREATRSENVTVNSVKIY